MVSGYITSNESISAFVSVYPSGKLGEHKYTRLWCCADSASRTLPATSSPMLICRSVIPALYIEDENAWKCGYVGMGTNTRDSGVIYASHSSFNALSDPFVKIILPSTQPVYPDMRRISS